MPWDLILGQIFSGLNSIFGGFFGSGGYSDEFPGSSFHAITAAFATQGYWAQADFIYFINETGFQSFAVLVYIGALIAGIVGMAMGAPPKQYLWYFMGPALFHFFLGVTVPVYGTAWKVAGIPQSQPEVWKLAETGLQSSNIALRENISVRGYEAPSSTVNVSWAFTVLDGLVSDTIQAFISWIGVYNVSGEDNVNSNTGEAPDYSKWHLLTNLKWGYLDTIASARLSSPELRDSFINFMAGKCGDEFQNSIDSSRYMSAYQSEGGSIPAGIFSTGSENFDAKTYASFGREKDIYSTLDTTLAKTKMPTPTAFKRMFKKSMDAAAKNASALAEPGSLEEAINRSATAFAKPGAASISDTYNLGQLVNDGMIACSSYLDVVVKGFRWEAAHLLHNLSKQIPGKDLAGEEILTYAMLYGWDLQNYKVEDLFNETGSNSLRNLIEEKRADRAATQDDKQQYLINLIFINMLKNEFLLAPNAAARKIKFTSAEQASNAVEMYQKTVGSRNKFGEIYSWALMMPYLQGLVLYILALGYPFACVMILVPRLSKIMITWSSFWIWAKFWDLGFAIVTLLERSVWATIGNSAKATQMNPFILQMSEWGTTKYGDSGSSLLPTILFNDLVEKEGPYASYRFLDRAMTLFSNMDLDLQNSFYIYIMAALYFAVPAITGQLVLGGKASIAGLVTGAFTDMAKETGGKAGTALTSQMQQQYGQATASANQAFAAKALMARQYDANGNPVNAGAMAQRALGSEFRQAMGQFNAATLRQAQEGIQNKDKMYQTMNRANEDSLKMGLSLAGLVSQGFAGKDGPVGLLLASSQPFLAGRGQQAMSEMIRSGDFDNQFGQAMGSSMSNSNAYMQSLRGSATNTDAQAEGVMPRGAMNNVDSMMAGNVSPDSMMAGNTSPTDLRALASKGLLEGAGRAVFGGVRAFQSGHFAAFSDLTSQAFTNMTTQQLAAWGRDSTADMAQMGIDGYQQSREAERLGIDANRSKTIAQGMMQDDVFYQNAAYQEQLAPLAATGIQIQGPGQKSSDYGYLTFSGLGGSFEDSQKRDLVNFAQDGGFFSQRINNAINNSDTGLQNFYGRGALMGLAEELQLSPMQAIYVGAARSAEILQGGQEAGGFTNPGAFISGTSKAQNETLTPLPGHNAGGQQNRPDLVDTEK